MVGLVLMMLLTAIRAANESRPTYLLRMAMLKLYVVRCAYTIVLVTYKSTIFGEIREVNIILIFATDLFILTFSTDILLLNSLTRFVLVKSDLKKVYKVPKTPLRCFWTRLDERSIGDLQHGCSCCLPHTHTHTHPSVRQDLNCSIRA